MKKLFRNRRVSFDRYSIDSEFNNGRIRVNCAIRAIRANWVVCSRRCRKNCVRCRGNCDRNNIRQQPVNGFFFEKVLPVVVCVDGKVILIAPLSDGQAAGFLIGEAGSPFLKMGLMKFLFCVHEINLLLEWRESCNSSELNEGRVYCNRSNYLKSMLKWTGTHGWRLTSDRLW